MNTNRASLIQFIQQTISLKDEMATAIAENFRQRSFKKGELFLTEGKISVEYLFLENGFMRSFLFDTEGNEITVNFFSPNSVVFEVASFFQKIPSQENIQALTDCNGWILTFDELNMLFHAIPEFREFGRAILVKGFVALKIRTLSMINKTAEQRYEALINSKPEIFQHSSLKYIASYLGITDTSLSRIRKEFSKK
jgi:CRP-like cAMP-binding protein